jgi:hypothetical protein
VTIDLAADNRRRRAELLRAHEELQGQAFPSLDAGRLRG